MVHQKRVLEAREHHHRQQPVGLAVRLGDEVRHDRHLRDVELEVAHHALEGRRGAALDVGERKLVGVGLELLRNGVFPHQRVQHGSARSGNSAGVWEL